MRRGCLWRFHKQSVVIVCFLLTVVWHQIFVGARCETLMPRGPEHWTLTVISLDPTSHPCTNIQPLGATYEEHKEGHWTPWWNMKGLEPRCIKMGST